MREEDQKPHVESISVTIWDTCCKQKHFLNKSWSLGDVLAHIADCMASNTKAMEAGFRKCTAGAYKHIRDWVLSPFTQMYSFQLESAPTETPFHRNKTHSKNDWMEEKERPVPATQYKYEITAGYRGARCGRLGCLWVSVKQLQISDRHFALLVAPLTHQPVWVHAWDAADCDHLGDRCSV